MSLKDLNKDLYLSDIALAKIFCFDYEIEVLQKKRLSLSRSMNNAKVIALDTRSTQ
jgi:UDP-3-O-acyl-N-acetylglucosamine deacetylase